MLQLVTRYSVRYAKYDRTSPHYAFHYRPIELLGAELEAAMVLRICSLKRDACSSAVPFFTALDFLTAMDPEGGRL
jgi:hypothetical protein